MERQITAEDQVIDIMLHTGACDLEDVMRQCANFTWNQVFLAVDRLSRKGDIVLVSTGHGTYMVTFPQRQEGRPDRRLLPS